VEKKDFKAFPTVFWNANITELFERAAYYAMASFVVLYLQQIGFGSYWPSFINGALWALIYLLPIFSGSMADHFGFRRALIVAFILLTMGYVLAGLPVWSGSAKLDASLGKKPAVVKTVAANTTGAAAPKASVKIVPTPSNPKPEAVPPTMAASMKAASAAVQPSPKPAPATVDNPQPQKPKTEKLPVTASLSTILMIVIGFVVIGLGGSIIKPCIAGAVAKFSPAKLATLGFAIFYMVINIGSLFGRGVSFLVRKNTDLSFIFAVSAAMTVLALFAVVMKYEEPPHEGDQKKSLKQTLLNMVLVLKQGRFMLFLVIVSGFAFVYHQVYNVIPLYLKHFVEDRPPVELYTMANPFVIVFFQLLITRLFGKMAPIRSIVVGMLLISAAMVINIIPLLTHTNLRGAILGTLPMGGLYAIITVAMIAFGELFEASRRFEFIGKLAPKGQEGLYMGYANLPMALGSIVGGPLGAYIFNDIMVKQDNQILGWLILAGVGVVSAIGIFLFALWIERQDAADAKA